MHNHGRNMMKKCMWERKTWDNDRMKTLFVIDGYDTIEAEQPSVINGIYSAAKL